MTELTTKSPRSVQSHADKPFASLERRVSALLRALTRWSSLTRTRRQLARLERHELPDIGLTQRQRQRECAKWFWQK